MSGWCSSVKLFFRTKHPTPRHGVLMVQIFLRRKQRAPPPPPRARGISGLSSEAAAFLKGDEAISTTMFEVRVGYSNLGVEEVRTLRPIYSKAIQYSSTWSAGNRPEDIAFLYYPHGGISGRRVEPARGVLILQPEGVILCAAQSLKRKASI